MNNAGIAGGLVAIGLGLATIGLSNFSQSANAVPGASLHAGPEEPQIVWYESYEAGSQSDTWEDTTWAHYVLVRAWSDGTVEMRRFKKVIRRFETGLGWQDTWCEENEACMSSWTVVASPTEGLNAAADINFDERVDGADMGQLLAAWGDAPRSPIPASDCPLGLMQ